MWRCIAPNEWQPSVVYIEKYKYCYKFTIYGAFSPDTRRITLPNCRLTSSRSTSWVSCVYISNFTSERTSRRTYLNNTPHPQLKLNLKGGCIRSLLDTKLLLRLFSP